MDLTKLTVSDAAWLRVVHPVTQASTDIRIKLAGADSEAYREQERKATNRRLNRAMRKGAGKFKVTAEELEEETLDLLAACTLDWENVIVDGAQVPFSRESAKELYTAHPWIKEQVAEFIGDRAAFLQS